MLAASFGEVVRLHDDWIVALSDSVAAVRSFHSCNMIGISQLGYCRTKREVTNSNPI